MASEEDLKRLLETKECLDGDLRFADLRGAKLLDTVLLGAKLRA